MPNTSSHVALLGRRLHGNLGPTTCTVSVYEQHHHGGRSHGRRSHGDLMVIPFEHGHSDSGRALDALLQPLG